MGRTKIGLVETTLQLPCLDTGFGTLCLHMLAMRVCGARSELVHSVLLPRAGARLAMGGSVVGPAWFATFLDLSSPSDVLGSA